ncbi:MAG: FAD-binding oxidoreductase, partial [Alphaproteobacteria bacterium]|nr:FAD-binding oxidoreductase [Alphaproteobacteria bacterium]
MPPQLTSTTSLAPCAEARSAAMAVKPRAAASCRNLRRSISPRASLSFRISAQSSWNVCNRVIGHLSPFPSGSGVAPRASVAGSSAIFEGRVNSAQAGTPAEVDAGMTSGSIYADGFKDEPYWWDAAAPPPVNAPALPDRVDVAVVGGGYCGLNCALELARRGASVAVLEAERIGFGASSRNGGMVSGGIKLASMNLAATLGAERADQLVAEAMGSLPFTEDLIRRERIDADYARSGRFLGAWSDAHYRKLEGQVELYRRLTGMRAEALPPPRQREEIGSDFYRGGLVAEAFGALHPAKYHQGLAAAARRA